MRSTPNWLWSVPRKYEKREFKSPRALATTKNPTQKRNVKMKKTLSLEAADSLVTKNDRWWWETYGKTLVHFTPARGTVLFRKDGYFNRSWRRGKGAWGTIKRHEVGNDGLFRV